MMWVILLNLFLNIWDQCLGPVAFFKVVLALLPSAWQFSLSGLVLREINWFLPHFLIKIILIRILLFAPGPQRWPTIQTRLKPHILSWIAPLWHKHLAITSQSPNQRHRPCKIWTKTRRLLPMHNSSAYWNRIRHYSSPRYLIINFERISWLPTSNIVAMIVWSA